jgi:hypothetical protein
MRLISWTLWSCSEQVIQQKNWAEFDLHVEETKE